MSRLAEWFHAPADDGLWSVMVLAFLALLVLSGAVLIIVVAPSGVAG